MVVLLVRELAIERVTARSAAAVTSSGSGPTPRRERASSPSAISFRRATTGRGVSGALPVGDESEHDAKLGEEDEPDRPVQDGRDHGPRFVEARLLGRDGGDR